MLGLETLAFAQVWLAGCLAESCLAPALQYFVMNGLASVTVIIGLFSAMLAQHGGVVAFTGMLFSIDTCETVSGQRCLRDACSAWTMPMPSPILMAAAVYIHVIHAPLSHDVKR